MRVATAILAVLTSFVMGIQALLAFGLSEEGTNTEAAGAFGVLGALLLFIGGALVWPAPRVAAALFALVIPIGFIGAASSSYGDLYFWGGWAVVLTVFALFGWRGKSRQDEREAMRDATLAQSLAAQQAMAAQIAAMQQASYQHPGGQA